MVSILPTNRSPWEAISESIGQGLSQTLPQAAQQRSQRETGLNAIDQLQRGIATANGDMSKILPELMRAYTLNQGLERSGLGQKYLETAIAGQYPGALGLGTGNGAEVGGGGNQAQPNPSITTPMAKEMQQTQPPALEGEGKNPNIDQLAGQYLAEIRPDLINPDTRYGAINTFAGINQQDLSPEDESRLRQQLWDKYKNPNIINQVVERVRESIKNKHNEALSQYKFDEDKINQINNKWKTFVNGNEQGGGTNARLAPHIDKYGQSFPKTKEILTNKYNQYASNLPTNMTPEDMHANAMALLQNDLTKLDALQAMPSMPPVRNEKDIAEYMNANKDVYRDLADQGFTEALREDAINNKDMGNEEFHSLIWGDQTSKPFLNAISRIKAPKEYSEISTTNPIMKYNPDFQKQREKYISDLSNKLLKMSPRDDLVLTRAMVLDGGGNLTDFTEALREAQTKGLKLSEFQKGQLQEANIPRVPPLWELFSEGGPTLGPLKFFNYNPFINYLRGKK